MDSLLWGLSFLFVYLDDILVASASAEEHLSHLHQLFGQLDEHGLIVNPAKCQFGLLAIDFLGHDECQSCSRGHTHPLPLRWPLLQMPWTLL